MTLLSTSIISLFATSIKMLSGFVISKAISIFVGPAGLGLVGQFQNFLQIVNTLGQGAISVGIIKYTAQLRGNKDDFDSLLSTGLRISLFMTLFVGFVLATLSEKASLFLFDSPEYQYLFIILSFTLIFSVINNFALMILNGLKEIRIWGSISVIQSFVTLVFTSVFTIYLGVAGALLSLVLTQALVFVVIIVKLRSHPVFTIRHFMRPFNLIIARKLWAYSLMAIFAAILLPVSHLAIRRYLIENFGLEIAGYWQAIIYISTLYLTMASIVFRNYYLPKLSETDDVKILRKEILRGFKLLVPLVASTSIAIYLLRDVVIRILFTNDFITVRDLFFWQLSGDIMKVCALMFAHIMLAKEMFRVYLLSELIFNSTFVLFSIIFTEHYGFIGISFAYFLNYSLYFLFTCTVTRRYWMQPKR